MDESETKDRLPTRNSCDSSAQEQSGLEHGDAIEMRQASLHSRKEQKRRLQIRTSCQRLCDLLPFVVGQLDTATTLELTAKYVSFLKQTLPPNVLSNVNKIVEENMKGLWNNNKKPPKKRKKIRLNKGTFSTAKTTAEGSKEGAKGQCFPPKPCEQVNLPSATMANPFLVEQGFHGFQPQTTAHAQPILLDESTVPRGQMLPVVCQNQCPPASFRTVQRSWMPPPSVFLSPMPGTFTLEMTRPGGQPVAGLDPFSSHVVILGQWVKSNSAHLHSVPLVNCEQACSLPDQTFTLVQQSHNAHSTASATGCTTSVDVVNQPLVPSLVFEGGTATPDLSDRPVSQFTCNSPPFQESICSSSSPLASSMDDTFNSFWIDLELDTAYNLCLPNANSEDISCLP